MLGSGDPGSLDAEVLCDRGDEEAGVLAPGTTVFIMTVFLFPGQMWFPVFSGWLSVSWSVFPYSQHFSNGKAVDEMVLVLSSSLLFRGLGIKLWLHSR